MSGFYDFINYRLFDQSLRFLNIASFFDGIIASLAASVGSTRSGIERPAAAELYSIRQDDVYREI